MKIPPNGMVLVADGSRMLFFRNEGDEAYPNLQLDNKREQDNPANQDQKTDRAGRAFASVGSARSGMEEPDFHQLEEDKFAAEAADLLKQRALAGDYESLIIVAPPKTLGELRKHYHVEVQKRLVGELDKELTGHPVDAIEKAIENA